MDCGGGGIDAQGDDHPSVPILGKAQQAEEGEEVYGRAVEDPLVHM